MELSGCGIENRLVVDVGAKVKIGRIVRKILKEIQVRDIKMT
jgi:hypothetical protein